MNIFQAQFTSGQVSAAAGVTNATLQSWLKRNLVIGQKDSPIEGGGSPGLHRRYSFYSVMEIAVAKALLDAGMGDVSSAFQAARSFAHVANSGRLPSVPFDTGATLLCASTERSSVVHWRPGQDPIANIFHNLRSPVGFMVLDIGKVFDSVTASLGYHPEKVKEAAYKVQGTH